MGILLTNSPAPYWIKQMEKVLLLNQVVLQEGHGLMLVLQVRPGGKIEQPKYTVTMKGE